MLGLLLLLPALAADPDEVLLVKAWSHIAFHHPAVAAEEVAWDSVLLDALAARKPKQAWSLLIEGLPPLEEAEDVTLPDGLAATPARVRDVLERSVHAQRTGRHPWMEVVGTLPTWSPPTHTDEALPEERLRVLAVARLWAAMRWFFPYLDGYEQVWNDALGPALDAVRAADTPEAYQTAIRRLAVQLNDGHIGVEGPGMSRPTEQLPFSIRSELGTDGPLVLQLRNPIEGMSAGDRIIAVDGVPFDAFAAPVEPDVSASTALTQLETRDRLAFEANAGLHTLTVRRPDGTTNEVETVLGIRSVFPRPHRLQLPVRRLADDIVAADLMTLRSDHLPELTAELENAQGLLFDLRGYPEYMPQTLVSCLSTEERPFVTVHIPRLEVPGTFTPDTSSAGGAFCPGPVYDGPVVLLVDHVAFSRAEYIAMAFDAIPRVHLVGSATAGTDGNRMAIPLPGRVRVFYSTIGVTYPDGRPTQRIGIQPDQVVHPTPEGLAAGRDEVMEAGLDWLRARPEPAE